MKFFGIFKHDYSVLFLNPRTNFNFLEIQKNHYLNLKEHCDNIWHFYEPENWNPHCGLTSDKSYKRIIETLGSLDHFSFPLEGRIEKIELVNFKEGKTIYSRNIK